MTASQSGKSARHVRWLSTGHGRACPDIRQSPQIVRQLAEFDDTQYSFVTRFTVKQFVASARSKSARSPAALKSP